MFLHWKKGHANCILARCRQSETQRFALAHEKLMRNLNQQSRTITCFGIAPAGTAMGEIDQDLNALFDDLMTLLPTNAGDKSDATGIVLLRRIVKTLRGRQAVVCLPASQGISGEKRRWWSFVVGQSKSSGSADDQGRTTSDIF